MDNMILGHIKDPNTGEIYIETYDLIELLKDIKNNPENYNVVDISKLLKQIKKIIPKPDLSEIDRPF
jgi:hypothetical protein